MIWDHSHSPHRCVQFTYCLTAFLIALLLTIWLMGVWLMGGNPHLRYPARVVVCHTLEMRQRNESVNQDTRAESWTGMVTEQQSQWDYCNNIIIHQNHGRDFRSYVRTTIRLNSQVMTSSFRVVSRCLTSGSRSDKKVIGCVFQTKGVAPKLCWILAASEKSWKITSAIWVSKKVCYH